MLILLDYSFIIKQKGYGMLNKDNQENQLVLRSVKGEADVAGFANMNAACNNAFEGATCACLMKHFPGSSYSNYYIVEDTDAGRIAATSCLIPWEISFDGVNLRAAMLEMVLSHPDYRRQGLIRKLIGHFHEESAAGNYDLNIITGIPYYYRQFGYTYCLDLYGEVTLDASEDYVPKANTEYSFRQACVSDIPTLMRFYNGYLNGQQVYAARSRPLWQYMMEAAGFDVRVLQSASAGTIVGYIIAYRGNNRLTVMESFMPQEAAEAVLGMLRGEAPGGISIGWPEDGAMAQAAIALGGRSHSDSQWLVQLRDAAALLQKLAPVFERRLSASTFAGYSGILIVNFYRNAIRMIFRDGKLLSSENAGFIDSSMGADGGDLCIPPDAFVRLLFGWRTLEQLSDAWPDIVIKKGSRPLIDVLFPPMRSWLNAPYHYHGNPEDVLSKL
jgi:GNAT superfamily N-acetyltransferase